MKLRLLSTIQTKLVRSMLGTSCYFGSNKFENIIITEILSQLRDLNNLLNIFMFGSLIILLKVKFGSDLNEMIIMLIAALTGVVSFSSYANCKSYLPLYKLYSLSSLQVFSGKFIGLFLLSIIQFFLISIITFTIMTSWDVYGYALLLLFNSTIIFFTIGLIFPTTNNSTVTSVLTIFMMLLFVLPLSIIIGKVFSSLSGYGTMMLIILVEVILITVSLKLFNWRYNNEYR